MLDGGCLVCWNRRTSLPFIIPTTNHGVRVITPGLFLILEFECNLPHYLQVARASWRKTVFRNLARLDSSTGDLHFCLHRVRHLWFLNFVADTIFYCWSLHAVTCMVVAAEETPSFVRFVIVILLITGTVSVIWFTATSYSYMSHSVLVPFINDHLRPQSCSPLNLYFLA